MINWTTIKKSIIGLAPMDGITDAAYRELIDKYSKPDVLFTEFVAVEGITHGVTSLFKCFLRHKTETPIIAQLFGSDLKAFYKATFIAAELGFDGIDINMGCPDNNIMKKGGGGALIGKPDHAKNIIKTVKEAVNDWYEGKSMEDAQVAPKIIEWIKSIASPSFSKRNKLPVTVKTRTGLDYSVTEFWISQLLEASPEAITLHGRTLLQMYKGLADWVEIEKASKLVRQTSTIFLGNGDVKTMAQAKKRIEEYDLDGILVGRGTLGNPWFFSDKVPTLKERFAAMVEHSDLYLKYRPELKLYPMRKHLAWYCTGFEGSRAVRDRLMKVVTIEDLKSILSSLQT
ncbi:tRNA-dihydrouridine synthase [Candidatus Roizmanbacteria bacterium]|nr:tRNA-dihydrouridine synthase [Candidatus Roizmanbacteria bacterium]